MRALLDVQRGRKAHDDVEDGSRKRREGESEMDEGKGRCRAAVGTRKMINLDECEPDGPLPVSKQKIRTGKQIRKAGGGERKEEALSSNSFFASKRPASKLPPLCLPEQQTTLFSPTPPHPLLIQHLKPPPKEQAKNPLHPQVKALPPSIQISPSMKSPRKDSTDPRIQDQTTGATRIWTTTSSGRRWIGMC